MLECVQGQVSRVSVHACLRTRSDRHSTTPGPIWIIGTLFEKDPDNIGKHHLELRRPSHAEHAAHHIRALAEPTLAQTQDRSLILIPGTVTNLWRLDNLRRRKKVWSNPFTVREPPSLNSLDSKIIKRTDFICVLVNIHNYV